MRRYTKYKFGEFAGVLSLIDILMKRMAGIITIHTGPQIALTKLKKKSKDNPK